jgi:glycosyltransferase involved in cell wall biosynthesis
MKILLISPTSGGIGGIAQHVDGLSQFLTGVNHEVDIISSANTFTIPIKRLKNPSFMFSSFLKTKFKKDNDIAHAHHIVGALAMKNFSCKKILSIHGVYSKNIAQLYGNTTSNISKKYEKMALNLVDAITVNSKEGYDYYTKMGFNVVQIPNAIDLNLIPKKSTKQFENQMIFAGRLSKEKGIEILLEAATQLPDNYHLLIAGSGPLEEKVRNLADKKTNVHYLGYQSKQNVLSLIRGSDLLIQPSLEEGMSSTLLEAMACGTCILGSNIEGISEIVENNKTGLLVEPNNRDELLNKILYLLPKKEKRLSMANEGLERVKKYDWKIVGKLYLNFYESLLNKSI